MTAQVSIGVDDADVEGSPGAGLAARGLAGPLRTGQDRLNEPFPRERRPEFDGLRQVQRCFPPGQPLSACHQA